MRNWYDIETRKIALVTDPAKSKYVNMTNIFLSIKNYVQYNIIIL